MRTRLLRASVVGALALGLMAGGAAPAMADIQDDTDAPELVSIAWDRTTIKPEEFTYLRITYRDAHPHSAPVYDWSSWAPSGMPQASSGDLLSESQPTAENTRVISTVDGITTTEIALKVEATASVLYGTYFENSHLRLSDQKYNSTLVTVPSLRIEDPEHPVDDGAVFNVVRGPHTAQFGSTGSDFTVYAGDTVELSLRADPRASVSYVWRARGHQDVITGSSRTIPGADVYKWFEVQARVTWPDGATRLRRAVNVHVEQLVVPYFTLSVAPTVPAVGQRAQAAFVKNPAAPFDLGAPVFTWVVNGRVVKGAGLDLVPGDDKGSASLWATFPKDVPAGFAIDTEPMRQYFTVGAGQMPDVSVSFGAARVGAPLVATVGPSKGATGVEASWVVDGKDVTFDEVPVAGGKISWTPDARFLGKSVRLAIKPFYGTAGVQGPRQLSSAQVKIAAGTQSLSTPKLSATVRVGARVSLQQGGHPAPGAKRSIVWLRNGKPISKATGWSYVPVAADKGTKLSARISSSAPGYANHVSSTSVKIVAAGLLKRGQVGFISTYQKVGETWKADVYGWDRGVTVKYQWLRDGKAIKKATASKYKLTRADRKHKVSLRITVSKPGYTSVTKTSNWSRVY